MKFRHITVPAVAAALLAAFAAGVQAATVSEIQGRSSNGIAGSTPRVHSIAVVGGRGHVPIDSRPAALPIVAGGEVGEFGRA